MPLFVGYIAAIACMLGWGSYFVPMKRVKNYDPIYYQTVMCVGIFLLSIVLTFFTRQFTFSYWAILSGILWASGNVLSILAIKRSHLAIAAPVWMGVAIFISFLWGVFFFRETIHFMFLSVTGIILLIVGIIAISQVGNERGSSDIKGIMFAALAGLLFGSYLVPFKLVNVSALTFSFSMSLGIIITGVVLFFLTKPKINMAIVLPGMASGIIWNIANIISFFAVGILGIAIGFPLTQMALFVSVLWGVLYFHEIKGRPKIIQLFITAIILFAGALSLSFSK